MIVLLPVLVTYAKSLFGVITTQHAALCVVGTDALLRSSRPSSLRRYDEAALAPAAPPNASDTISRPRSVNSNPKGVAPADAWTIAAPARSSGPTWNVRILFVAFSVTTSCSPSGSNSTCAAPAVALLSARVELAIGESVPPSLMWNPLMFPVPPALSAYTTSPCDVTLTGVCPPDAIVFTSDKPSRVMRNDES